MKLTSILTIFSFMIYSCSSDNKEVSGLPVNPIDSFESATPHGKTLKTSELSSSDKVKLAQASGITAEVLTFDSLRSVISQDSSGLVIYNFWDLDCQSCRSNNRALKKMQSEFFDSQDIKVVYINVDGLFPDMINSYIRENEIIDKVYIVDMHSVTNWPSYFQNGWEGQLPALLIVNNADGTRLFYQKDFSVEELEAVILPLTL